MIHVVSSQILVFRQIGDFLIGAQHNKLHTAGDEGLKDFLSLALKINTGSSLGIGISPTF